MPHWSFCSSWHPAAPAIQGLRQLPERLELSVGDEAADEFEERFVDVGSAFPADAQTAEAMAPGEGPLDHPPVGAQSCAVTSSAPGDGRHDASGADLVAVDVVVVATVGEERVGSAAGTPDSAADRRDRVEQGQKLGDVVAVAPVSRTASGVPCPSVIT
jgi:hypothetical protein